MQKLVHIALLVGVFLLLAIRVETEALVICPPIPTVEGTTFPAPPRDNLVYLPFVAR